MRSPSLSIPNDGRAALQKIGRSCLAQLLRNEPAVLAAEPEGVHQMRVAVRRLRSAVSSLKKAAAGRGSSAGSPRSWVGLAGALGPARNLDVFAAELLPGGPRRTAGRARLGRPRRRHSTGCGSAAYDQITGGHSFASGIRPAMLRLLRWFEARGWRRHRTG